MSTSSVESAALSALQASYTAYEAEETKDSTALGSEDFLTLLVAQLANQNPLDPTDTSQFTDQLAQYTQVEQLINLNDKMDVMLQETTDSEATTNPTDFVGMQVTGTVNTMTIEDGSVTSGFYTLSESAEVVIVIEGSDGNVVTTLSEGQQEAGSFLVTWDGTDDEGNSLDEGSYTYTVMANTGDGYEEVSSTITGTVDAVAYKSGTAYLVVGGVLLDPSSLTSATESAGSSSDETATSILEYLGKTVSSNYPLVQVDDGQVAGENLGYNLETPSDVTITIYNASSEAVATIEVSDGLFYYTVETESGSATTEVAGEVTGIQYINGVQYLALGESGRMVSLSSITSVQ